MGRNVFVGKKGASTVTLMKYFGMAMAAVVIVLLLLYWREVKNNTFLERNYLARDISLLLTAAYASPGDLTYCYYAVGGFSGRFDYLIEKSRVVVADSSIGGEGLAKGAAYFYAEDASKPLPKLTIADADSKDLAVLRIFRNQNVIAVDFRKKGEDASPCKP